MVRPPRMGGVKENGESPLGMEMFVFVVVFVFFVFVFVFVYCVRCICMIWWWLCLLGASTNLRGEKENGDGDFGREEDEVAEVGQDGTLSGDLSYKFLLVFIFKTCRQVFIFLQKC